MTSVLSIILFTAILWHGSGGVSGVTWASVTDQANFLSHERWDRRDPFSPLRELTEGTLVSVSGASGVQADDYRYRPDGRRDPFRSVLDIELGRKPESGLLTPLEQFEPSQLRFVGVMWNDDGYRALLETPDGLAYTARLGTAIGGSGMVSAVNEEQLLVRQSYKNVFGETKFREIGLDLYKEVEEAATSSPSILAATPSISGDAEEAQAESAESPAVAGEPLDRTASAEEQRQQIERLMMQEHTN